MIPKDKKKIREFYLEKLETYIDHVEKTKLEIGFFTSYDQGVQDGIMTILQDYFEYFQGMFKPDQIAHFKMCYLLNDMEQNES